MTRKPDKEVTSQSARNIADRLIAGSSKILEDRMRDIYFCERLAELDERTIVEILRRLLRQANDRHPGALLILNSLGDGGTLVKNLGPSKLSRVYHGAVRLKYQPVVRLLSRPRASRQYAEADDDASQYAMNDRTIGERRYLARGRDKDTLDKLTYDLDPLVIRELLGNPLIIEKQVVKIAARRPCTPEVLTEIARHPRWSNRQSIREALVRNPYVDPRLALSLVPMMLVPQLRQIVTSSEIHVEIRRHAHQILTAKSGLRKR